MRRCSSTAASGSIGRGLSGSSAGRPMSSSPLASVAENEPQRRVRGEADQAQAPADEQQETIEDDVDGCLHKAVEDTKRDISPGEVNVDVRVETHQDQRERDRIKDRRLLEQMIII